MEFPKTKEEITKIIREAKNSGKTIGFVPTMGALHKGHLSLFENARKDNDIVVGSIFVNPIQFNDPSDYRLYPRNVARDLDLLSGKADIIFLPEESVMYPDRPTTTLSFGHLETVMEGSHRPGHFNGVAIVVSKLFHFVQPDAAYFGQKDLQQVRVIERLVHDLSFPLSVRMCPVIREASGLAMSSRNMRLSPEGRETASKIYRGLILSSERLKLSGDASEARKQAENYYGNIQGLKLEYFEIVNAETLMPPQDVHGKEPIALCVAAWLENVRLIDNIILFS